MDKSIQLLRPVDELYFEADSNVNLAPTDNELCEFVSEKLNAKVGDVIVIDNNQRYLVTKDGHISLN